MSGTRELILERLRAIAADLPGAVTAGRNRRLTDDLQRPALIVVDGDEKANDDDPHTRQNTAPRRVDMYPQIVVLLGARPEDIGTELNGWLAALVDAVVADAELASITGTSGYVRYLEMKNDLSVGRSMEGAMVVIFKVGYVRRL